MSVHHATQIPELVAGQLALSVESHNGRVLDCTGVQTPGVLDDVLYTDEPLGDTYDRDTRTHRISVWVSARAGRQEGREGGRGFEGQGKGGGWVYFVVVPAAAKLTSRHNDQVRTVQADAQEVQAVCLSQ